MMAESDEPLTFGVQMIVQMNVTMPNSWWEDSTTEEQDRHMQSLVPAGKVCDWDLDDPYDVEAQG